MKRKIASISLLLILTVPAVLTFTWLKYQKKAIKHEVKWKIAHGIDENELVLLKFTEAGAEKELDWEHSKEFEYRQQMYDVVRKETVGDTTYYWCWWDNEESVLNRQLAGLVSNLFNADPQKKEKQNRLVSFYTSFYFEESGAFKALLIPEFKRTNFQYQLLISSITIPLPSPPPKRFS